MTNTIRLLVLLLGMGMCIVVLWPHGPMDVVLSRGAATEALPVYQWAEGVDITPLASVYMRDGQPRYMLRHVEVTAEEFRRARSPEEWEQVQAWIREQQKRNND